MTGIINYGLGNIQSVYNMLRYIGSESKIIDNVSGLCDVDRIILPGVGSFDAGMEGLQRGGWVEVLHSLVEGEQIPVLGICLGMQLMCRASEEGNLPGLGWIDAQVVKLTTSDTGKYKVPHMGWNTIDIKKTDPLLNTLMESEWSFYFVHSYHVNCNQTQDILATTLHGMTLTAAISRANIYGVQFHPEKSHKYGMQVLKNFISL